MHLALSPILDDMIWLIADMASWDSPVPHYCLRSSVPYICSLVSLFTHLFCCTASSSSFLRKSAWELASNISETLNVCKCVYITFVLLVDCLDMDPNFFFFFTILKVLLHCFLVSNVSDTKSYVILILYPLN